MKLLDKIFWYESIAIRELRYIEIWYTNDYKLHLSSKKISGEISLPQIKSSISYFQQNHITYNVNILSDIEKAKQSIFQLKRDITLEKILE